VLNVEQSFQKLLWLADLAKRVLKKLRLKEKQTSKGASKAGELSRAVPEATGSLTFQPLSPSCFSCMPSAHWNCVAVFRSVECDHAEKATETEQAVGRILGALCAITAKDDDAESAMLASWISQVLIALLLLCRTLSRECMPSHVLLSQQHGNC
jgi:hypothetical protein